MSKKVSNDWVIQTTEPCLEGIVKSGPRRKWEGLKGGVNGRCTIGRRLSYVRSYGQAYGYLQFLLAVGRRATASVIRL